MPDGIWLDGGMAVPDSGSKGAVSAFLMDTLSHADWLRLHEVTLGLHEAPSLSSLPSRVFEGLRYLFPYDTGSFQDDRGGAAEVPWLIGDQVAWQGATKFGAQGGMRAMPSWAPDFLPLRAAWLAVSAERHPHTSYYRRTGDGAARRLTEIVPMGRLRQTKFYNEISRPLGVRWQLTVYMPLTPANTLTLAACRCETEFDDRERLLLDLLRPHVSSAWHRALREERRTATGSPVNDAATLIQLGVTRREAEVLWWVAQGKTNREIALIVERSPLTIKLHVERILAKLGCETRTAAARTALEILVCQGSSPRRGTCLSKPGAIATLKA